MKKLIIAIIFVVAIFATYSKGYNNAILDAELVEISEDYYLIAFGDEVHEYGQ